MKVRKFRNWVEVVLGLTVLFTGAFINRSAGVVSTGWGTGRVFKMCQLSVKVGGLSFRGQDVRS